MRSKFCFLIILGTGFSCSETKVENQSGKSFDLSLCPCLLRANDIDSARICDSTLSDVQLRETAKYCYFHKEEWNKDTLK